MKEKMAVKITSEKVYKRRIMMKIVIIAIVILLLFTSIIYAVLYVVNSGGNFTISLDPNLKANYNIVMSPYEDFRETFILLKADALEYMDNITESWLPEDIDNVDGEHSKDNYIAYTFYVKNKGKDTIDLLTTIEIKSVIKNVDEAVRVAVYHNGTKKVYAKYQKGSKAPEPNTIAFNSNTKVMKEIIKEFKANQIEKYTVVIWLEGNDPECIDNILGGEMKMLMVIRKLDLDNL